MAEDRNDDVHIEPDDDADALTYGAEQGEPDEAERGSRAAAYARLLLAEQRLYDYWEQRGSSQKDWVGELVGEPVYEDTPLWLAALATRLPRSRTPRARRRLSRGLVDTAHRARTDHVARPTARIGARTLRLSG